jgi:ribosome recycling factor
MDNSTILSGVKAKFDKAQAHFSDELKKVRTGRAHPSMLDGITATAYGTPMPLIQLATITAPEPQLLQLSPFDPGNITAIVAAIRDNQTLGLNPVDDGHVIRVPVPPLTTERRQEMAKQLGTKVEDAMIAMRQARHEALKDAETAKKDRKITEDDYSLLQKQVDEAMQQKKTQIESLAKAKEQEILTV